MSELRIKTLFDLLDPLAMPPTKVKCRLVSGEHIEGRIVEVGLGYLIVNKGDKDLIVNVENVEWIEKK